MNDERRLSTQDFLQDPPRQIRINATEDERLPALTPQSYVARLKGLNIPNTFNPYADRCQVYDRNDSPAQRAKILENMLSAAHRISVDAIWLGRDLGHRGGRRTGLALTDDVSFSRHLQRWGLTGSRPTKGAALAEQTAQAVWDMLDQITDAVFLWNVFPLHPFPAGQPFANRSHNAEEGKLGQELLSLLCAFIQPNRIVCLGNDAFHAARNTPPSISTHRVRHPSFGGQNHFREQISSLYKL